VIATDPKTGVVTGRVATDYEGDPLRYKIIDAPDHGAVVLNPDGTFVYTPNRDETRELPTTDSFTVVVSDATNPLLHLFGRHTTTVKVDGISLLRTNTVVDTVTGAALKRPEDLAINPAGTRVYVTDGDANKVHVIKTEDNTIETSITVGPKPDGVAVVVVPDGTPTGKAYVYVANFGNDKVSVIDTATNTVVKEIDLDPSATTVAGLQQVAGSPDGKTVYVTGFNGVYLINTATNTAPGFISLQDSPLDSNRYDIAITPNGQFAYVPDFAKAGAAGGDINLVNLNTAAVNRIPAAPDRSTEDVVISPDGRYVYLSSGSLLVLDTTTNAVVARIDNITDARGLALSPDGKRLYVSRFNFDNVTVVDTETLTIVTTIPVKKPWNVAVTPDGTRAYVVSVPIDPTAPKISVIALQAPAKV
jgi:YVTN family beta-propeller protein